MRCVDLCFTRDRCVDQTRGCQSVGCPNKQTRPCASDFSQEPSHLSTSSDVLLHNPQRNGAGGAFEIVIMGEINGKMRFRGIFVDI